DANFFVNNQTVYHDINGMLLLGVQFDPDIVSQLEELSIDTGPHEPFASEPLDDVAKFALLFPHHGSEEHHACFGRKSEDFIHDVTGGLGVYRDASFRAVR